MPADQVNKQYDQKHIATAALQFFFNLSHHWGLSAQEEQALLGHPPKETFDLWKTHSSANKLNRDTLDRISYLMGIHKALINLLPSTEAAMTWLKKPNDAPLFAGGTALNRMLGGSIVDLSDVRRYLDAQGHL